MTVMTVTALFPFIILPCIIYMHLLLQCEVNNTFVYEVLKWLIISSHRLFTNVIPLMKLKQLVNIAFVVIVANNLIQLVQIHFQNLYLVLMNPSRVVGFGHSRLLLTSHTLMLTLQMF
jgi:hypothetical protein